MHSHGNLATSIRLSRVYIRVFEAISLQMFRSFKSKRQHPAIPNPLVKFCFTRGTQTFMQNHRIVLLKLEDLTVLKRSPDLLNNDKIGQDQLQLIMKHILFYGRCGHFRQVT